MYWWSTCFTVQTHVRCGKLGIMHLKSKNDGHITCERSTKYYRDYIYAYLLFLRRICFANFLKLHLRIFLKSAPTCVCCLLCKRIRQRVAKILKTTPIQNQTFPVEWHKLCFWSCPSFSRHNFYNFIWLAIISQRRQMKQTLRLSSNDYYYIPVDIYTFYLGIF